MGLGKEIDYQVVQGWERIHGNPVDSGLFYDDSGASMEFSNACGCEAKSNADWSGAVTAGLGAVGSVAGAVGKGKTDVKQACGKKPLFAKNRGSYNACVKKYNEGTLVGKNVQVKDGTTPTVVNEPTKPKNNTMVYVAIGGGVILLAVILYSIKNKNK